MTKPSVEQTTISGHLPVKLEDESRPDFNKEKSWTFTKTVNPKWKQGSGATLEEWCNYKKIEIDPLSSSRSPSDNYKLLISAIVPRPIAFVSTQGKNGKRNLAPFSYFNLMNSDPPIFALGIRGSKANPKDTLKNLIETEELTINIINEWFIEAANFCAVNAPYEVDEWLLSGLTPLNCSIVKPPQVAESAVSIEAKLVATHEWELRIHPGKATGVMCIVEGVKIHVREDLLNEEQNKVDLAGLRPVTRLGGITYARVSEGFEIPRPDYASDVTK